MIVDPRQGFGFGPDVDLPDRKVGRKSASHGEAGYERRPHEAYFTEPWVTRALLQAVDLRNPRMEIPNIVWEPACGDGRMARELKVAGYAVYATDIADWGYGESGIDFLHHPRHVVCAAIVTNPPFGDDAHRFIQRALDLTKAERGKVAMLQRHEFDAPATNHPLFAWPFAAKLILHKRPRWSDEPETASPRFPYAWYLWDWAHEGPAVLRYLPDPDKTPAAVGRLI